MNFRMESRWIEEVVVTATRLRNSQAEALARQQSADRRVDIIAADNIGQFPDKNAAEALTRLPGVSADLAAGGRPRTVQIRGMPDRWTTVAYDGLNIIGSRGRVVRFDEIPAAIINSVELSKTTTPDMAAESVSGAVNIVTASPFDFEGFFANVATSGGTAGYDEDPQKEFSIQMGSQNDDGRFGWMVVGAMLEREFKEERFQSENLVGENTGIVYPSQLDLTNSRYQQSTPGGALRLEWRPDDLSRIFLTTVYTRTEDDIDEQSINVVLEDGSGFDDPANNPRRGRIDDAPLAIDVTDRETLSSTWTTTLGGEREIWGGLLEYRGNYTRTEQFDNREIGLTVSLGNGPQVNYIYDYSGDDVPDYTLEESTATDPDNGQRLQRFKQDQSFGLDIYVPVSENADTDAWSTRLDFGRDADWLDIAGRWKTGFAFDIREQNGLATSVPVATVGVSENAATGGAVSLPPMVGTGIADFGVAPISSIDFAGSLTGNTWDSDIDRHYDVFYYDTDRLLAEFRAARDRITDEQAAALNAAGFPYVREPPPGNLYTTTETIIAQYFQHTFFLDWGSIVAGVRAEYWRLDADGFEIQNGNTVPLSADQSRFDLFPSVNIRWDISDTVVLRSAATVTTSRPNFFEVRPGTVVDDREGVVFLGNPNLEPEMVYSIDTALEWYDERGGLLSASLFYKYAEDVRSAAQIIGNNGEYNEGVTDRSDYTSILTVNGGDGWVSGIEIAALQYFDFLPGALAGLGIQANIAFLDSEYEAPTLQGGTRDISLPGTSDYIFNASIFWEKFGFTARLNFQQRSEWITSVALAVSQPLDSYRDEGRNLSGSLKYQINDAFSVRFDGKNLTDERRRTFNNDPDNLLEIFAYGRSYSLTFNYAYF